jgi:hypothetical protein
MAKQLLRGPPIPVFITELLNFSAETVHEQD